MGACKLCGKGISNVEEEKRINCKDVCFKCIPKKARILSVRSETDETTGYTKYKIRTKTFIRFTVQESMFSDVPKIQRAVYKYKTYSNF